MDYILITFSHSAEYSCHWSECLVEKRFFQKAKKLPLHGSQSIIGFVSPVEEFSSRLDSEHTVLQWLSEFPNGLPQSLKRMFAWVYNSKEFPAALSESTLARGKETGS